MAVRLIRASDLVRVPWKNGGGTTAEVMVAPPGAGLDDFDWRVSMADVASEGPFSRFTGVDRTLVLIEGTAIDLDVDGDVSRLGPATAMLGFSGEVPTRARLPHGPIRDLNVMTRRGAAVHRVRLTEAAGLDVASRDSTLLVVALVDALDVVIEAGSHRLDRLDTLIIEPPAGPIRFSGRAILVELRLLMGALDATSSPA